MSDSKPHPVDLSEVRCPDSCNLPEAQKGCHFRASAEAFTCAECRLKIRRLYNGYVLEATDLQELLHGEKITAAKPLKNKDGKESSARLMLDQNYRVCKAPKNKAVSKEETKEACPNCGAKLLLVTKGDGSKYYGCGGSAKCTYAREYVPHAFKQQPRVRPGLGEDQPAPAKDAPKAADEASLLLQPATPDPDAQIGPLLDPSGRPETDGVPYSDAQLPSGAIFSDPLWSLPAEIAEPLIAAPPPEVGKFQRIPKFVKDLLGLSEEALKPAQLEIETAPVLPLKPPLTGAPDPEKPRPRHPELALTEPAHKQHPRLTRPVAPAPDEPGPAGPGISLS